VALGLLALLMPGCLSCFNPIAYLAPDIQQECQSISPQCRDNVYVVLVDGIDPLGCGNFKGVREYLNSLGFVKCYYAQVYHEKCLLDELRYVRSVHPDARIAVVGFECGAGPAKSLACKALEEGLSVDLLVLLQPKILLVDSTAPSQTIPRVVALQTDEPEMTNPIWDPDESIKVPCGSRYRVPTHAVTLQTLAEELSQLAANAPVTIQLVDPPSSLQDKAEPTPRPVVPTRRKSTDEWDFLKPGFGGHPGQTGPVSSLEPNDSE
jgi:hypothetical protein